MLKAIDTPHHKARDVAEGQPHQKPRREATLNAYQKPECHT
jgi:hypothetical protein